MDDMQEVQRRARDRLDVARCDTFTVIEGARKSLYNPQSGGGGGQPSPWIEEALERFEHQLRAGLGAPQLVPAGSSGGT